MDNTLHVLASALGVEPLTAAQQTLLLDCTRDVAHTTQRRFAPLAAYLAGVAVGRSGGPEALPDAVAAIAAALAPEGPMDG